MPSQRNLSWVSHNLRPRRVSSDGPTWGWGWVLVGLFGVLVVLLGQVLDLPGYLERAASWWRPLLSVPGHALLLYAWWQLGPKWRRPLLTAAIWSLPMMFTLPLHSRDAYAYGAQGWLAANGIDPYSVTLGAAGQPGLLVGVHWHNTTSVYPAGSVELFGLISRLTGGDLYWTTVALRLPSVLALAILAVVLPALARRVGVSPHLALWAGLLNPIMLVQWIGGVHNDALMVALCCAALLAATDPRWRGLIIAGLLLGLAMSLKQSAAVFGLGVVAIGWAVRFPAKQGWVKLVPVAVVPGLITVAVFLATSWRFGLGWRADTAGNPIAATSNTPLSWVASFLRYHELLPNHTVANTLVTGLSTLLILTAFIVLWLKLGPFGHSVGKPWWFATAVVAAACALAPALQPWYLTWVLPLFALCRLGKRWDWAWLICIVGFALLPGLQDVLAPYISMFTVAPLLYWLWRQVRRADAPLLEPVPVATPSDL